MAINQQKINQLMTAIVNNTTSLISSHNNNNTAHSDIRTLLNTKIDKSSTEGLVKNDGSIDTNTYLTSQDLTNYEITTNKVTSLSSSSTNTQYPSAKCVYDKLEEINDLIGDAITFINK